MELSFNVGTLLSLGAKAGWGVLFIFVISSFAMFTSGRLIYERVFESAPVDKAGQITHAPVEVVAERSNVNIAAPVVANQSEVRGEANVAGRDIIRQQTILNQTFYRTFEEGDLSGSQQRVQVKTDTGKSQSVDIWVIWNDASWHSSAASFNESKLQEFFASSRYQATLRDAGAIACVGLASSKMTDELRKSPDRDERMRRLSETRARVLCSHVADQSMALKDQPLLLGVGLGFNEKKAGTDEEERKQRAITLVHIGKIDGTRPATKAEATEVVRQLLFEGSLNDLRPRDYSQVQDGRSVCWFSLEKGKVDITDCG